MKITDAVYPALPDEGISVVAEGRPARIALTKKLLLDLGITVLSDRDDVPPWFEHQIYLLPGNKEEARGELRIAGGTNDAVAVCLARRFWLAINRSGYKPGPVEVPSEAEAAAELLSPSAWKKGI
jgi:hypothetical protein